MSTEAEIQHARQQHGPLFLRHEPVRGRLQRPGRHTGERRSPAPLQRHVSPPVPLGEQEKLTDEYMMCDHPRLEIEIKIILCVQPWRL